MRRFIVYERSLCQSYRSAVQQGADYCSFDTEDEARRECVECTSRFGIGAFYIDSEEGRLSDPVAGKAFGLDALGLGASNPM